MFRDWGGRRLMLALLKVANTVIKNSSLTNGHRALATGMFTAALFITTKDC